MAIIDRIKYDGPPDILVAKYPKDNIVAGGQLIVNESQEALFYKGGQALDLFGPGTHTLSSKNIPLLQKLVNLPFGGETPFAAEVFFINRTAKLDYKWGTKSPIQIEDPKYEISVNVGSFGQFGLRVEDSRVFVTQIVGTMPSWTSDKVLDYFRGLIITKVKDSIAKYLVVKNISITTVSAFLDELSKLAEDQIRQEFAKYGLSVLNFFIQSIAIAPEELKKIQETQQKRFEMKTLGYDYKTMRQFDVMEAAASNEGTVGGLMGAGIGLGIGAQMASGPMANLVGKAMQPGTDKTIQPPAQVGNQLQAAGNCPKCNEPVATGSKFCGSCGTPIPAKAACPSCGTPVEAGVKFCGACGTKLGQSGICKSCGKPMAPNAKFCGECGAQTT
jgi:membrane protease subunit (stomatin/prohibitin family)